MATWDGSATASKSRSRGGRPEGLEPRRRCTQLASVEYLSPVRRANRGSDYAAGKITAAKPSVQWLEAVLAPPPGSVIKTGCLTLVLHLPGGVRVEMSDMKQVEMAAALVRALQKPC